MSQVQSIARAGRRLHVTLAAALILCGTLLSSVRAQQTAGSAAEKVKVSVAEGRHGMVVSVSPEASQVGLAVLKRGGNAVDAALATAFALTVTYPSAGNIGGGGFMLVRPAGAEPVAIDYRQTAPAAVTPDLFAKEARPDQTGSRGHRIVSVPGMVRGMELAHQRFGKLSWAELVFPAAELAEKGFAIGPRLAQQLNRALERTRDFPEFQRVFHKDGGWKAGDRLVQPELAKTLRLIAAEGAKVFYEGTIADQIEAEMKAGGGLIRKADLAGYQALERPAVHGRYRGYDVYAPPPPTGGGVLVEMLHILEPFDLKKQGRWSPATIHLMVESMRRAYCDRARYLGDPAFTKIPDHLTTKEYADKLAREISLTRATPSAELAPDIPLAKESSQTTHFSIIDQDGMAVSNTYTLNADFGSYVVVKGAGFLLNNEMTAFNWRPGYTSRDGVIGTAANLLAPGKRMQSSMTPTIVLKDGKVLLITGSPGGKTILNTILCVLVNVLEFDMDIADAVAAPRLHHQWMPDKVYFEGIQQYPELVQHLRLMGHVVLGTWPGTSARPTRQGDAHSIWVDPRTGTYRGVADNGISGGAAGY